MESKLTLALGKRAKELVREAESAAYSITGLASEPRGSAMLQKVQDRVNDAVRKEKVWRRELWGQVNQRDYFLTAVVEENSIRLLKSPALSALLNDCALTRSEDFCVANDAAIEARKADKLMSWIDNLKEGSNEETNQIIRQLKRDFHNEVALAKFIYENAPK